MTEQEKKSIFDYLDGASDGLNQGFKDGYNKALKDIKDASIIFNGEELYGHDSKVIVMTEEKYHEIFG